MFDNLKNGSIFVLTNNNEDKMNRIYEQLKKHSEKIYDLNRLFFYEIETGLLYTHDEEWAREELEDMGFEYAYSEDFDMETMNEEMIFSLNETRADLSEKNNENFTAYIKDCYETLILERTYTATEYKKLLDEKNQLEKTLNTIKGLL